MNSGIKTALFANGYLLVALAIFMLIPYVVEITIGDGSSVFLISAILTGFFGALLIIVNKTENRNLSIPQALLMTNLFWISVTFFSSLPLMYSSLRLSFTDAFFESMSGITTTGSTILPIVENASKGVLVWRSMLQWIGGLGIIVISITVLPLLNIGGLQLFKSEGTDFEKVIPKSKEISVSVIRTYIIITILCTLSYFIGGMDLFDAINHSLTTVSTGGYSTHSDSFGYFKSSTLEIISIIFILSGSIPFLTYFKFANGDYFNFFKDDEVRGFLYFLTFSIIIIYIYNIVFVGEDHWSAFMDSAFNVTSIITGTGYTTEDYDKWGNFALYYFLILMFVGGCSASTTCGMKVFRFQIVIAFINAQIKKIFYPDGVFFVRYKNHIVDDKTLSSVLSFFCLYILIFFIITALLALTGLDFVTALSAAASTLSCVGPGFGHTIGPDGSFFALSDTAKWICSLAMLLGRLELFTVLVLIVPSFWRN